MWWVQLKLLLDIEELVDGNVVLLKEVLKQQVDGLVEQLKQLDAKKLRKLWKTGH